MTLDLGELVLRGRDVLLRSLSFGDVEALTLAAAESRESYALTPVPNGRVEAEAYVDHALQQRASGERHAFAIEWQGRVVGSTSYTNYQPWSWPKGCALARVDRPDAVEIGHTWLAASAQRTDCNAQCKLLLLEQAFERWSVHSVFLRTDARNQRSRRAIEALGREVRRRAARPHPWLRLHRARLRLLLDHRRRMARGTRAAEKTGE
jgi:N-acetyltransferase